MINIKTVCLRGIPMPVKRIVVTGNTKEEAQSKFESKMLDEDIICYPHEKEVIDCTNNDKDWATASISEKNHAKQKIK